MQPTTFTFAPRLRKSAPTAPSGAAPERPNPDERRQNRRQQDGQADRRTAPATQSGERRRPNPDGSRAEGGRSEARRDDARAFDGRRDTRRADGQYQDRSERPERRAAPQDRFGAAREAASRVGTGQERPRDTDRPGVDRGARSERSDRAPVRGAGAAPADRGLAQAGGRRTEPARGQHTAPVAARRPEPGRAPRQEGPRGVRPMPSRPAVAPASADTPPLESFFADAAALNLNPAESFSELSIRRETRAAVEGMGITVPTPIQANAIPVMLDGRDIVGQAKTGSGKTLAFALPTVERCDPAVRAVQALILVPTRELAIQVGQVIEKLTAARRLKLTLLYGGRSLIPEARALSGGAQIVVGTPGRTLDHLRQRNFSLDGLRIFVLDEGDEMLDRGFAPDVERILAFTPPTRQTAMFSATVPPWVMQTAMRHLRTPVLVKVDVDEAPPEIEHIVYDVDPTTRSAALRTLLDRRGDGPIIVFGRTKHGVKKLARQLESEGFPVVALHGNLSQNARERAMVELRAGNLPILVATNVAARGIDIADVGQVINYEVPESAELFTHRVGRTGRMGRSGEAITFVTPDEAAKWRQIERALGKTLPRQPWMVDGQPVPVAAAMPAPQPVAVASAAPRAETRRADAPRPDGERRRPRWRRGPR
ncbi:MAG: DEAD/DEAH box helicase [Chloroflexi bacterium]|nr:DEAD/DEAH box helicase [Chloroflexota bacterium]